MDFKELKSLNLGHNDLKHIKVLNKVKLEKLEVLLLNGNIHIDDNNVLETVNFKELKELDLGYNHNFFMEIFEKAHFEKMENK